MRPRTKQMWSAIDFWKKQQLKEPRRRYTVPQIARRRGVSVAGLYKALRAEGEWT